MVEFDIAKFFDSVPWDLLVKAVEAHTDAVWVNLYVRRWLAAPLLMPDGTLHERERGTPQGAPVSPVLANLFLHYAFDTWMAREFPTVWFERYADDAVLHCVSEHQARRVLAALTDRMAEVGLQLHPAKTRIIYCKDGTRPRSYEHTAFTFLGYTFRARKNRHKSGKKFLSFEPADQQGSPDEDRTDSAVLAPAHPDRPDLQRARTEAESSGVGLDQLLRALSAVGVGSLRDAHQRLPGAMGPQEVQTVRGQTEGAGEGAGDREAIPPHVRPLAPHSVCECRGGLKIRATRAV